VSPASVFRFVILVVTAAFVSLGLFYAAATGGVGPFRPWQLASLLIAGLLTIVWLAIGIRGDRPASLVVSTLMFFVPAAGFAYYGAEGGPEPSFEFVTAMVLFLYVVAAAGLLLMIIRRRRSDIVLTLAALDRRVARGFAIRLLLTLWFTVLLFAFEPLLAIANVVLNALWEVLWIPKRGRTFSYEHVADIAAPRQEVFDFIADPANWPRYRDGVAVFDVQPPGPLRTGTRYTARVPLAATIRGLKARELESHIVVLEAVPGRSIASMDPARPGLVTVTEVGDAPGGSRLIYRTTSVTSFIQASQGVMLGIRRESSSLKDQHGKRTARLKQILETAPSN
jgi:hypothetical protein